MKRWIAIFLVLLLLLSGCQKGNRIPDLSQGMAVREPQYSLQGGESSAVQLNHGAADALRKRAATRPPYALADLLDAKKTLDTLEFDAAVEVHRLNGPWTAEALTAQVKENNAAYLRQASFEYADLEDAYLKQVVVLVLDTMEQAFERYPEIDRARVGCILGELKILYDKTTLDFARVTEERVLALAPSGPTLAEISRGKGAYRNVLIHETMHLLQLGCGCETPAPAVSRRCGICVYREDWPLNGADWDWFFEGSAELATCKLTQAEPVTYTRMIQAISALSMALMDGYDDEKISFYSNPDRFFERVSAPREETAQMMVALKILLGESDAFYDIYFQKTGKDPAEDPKVLADMEQQLLLDVCGTLTGCFYTSLADLLEEQAIPAEDLFLLISLFEAQLIQLGFGKACGEDSPALGRYRSLRLAFLQELGLEERFASYTPLCGTLGLNGRLAWMTAEERAFLLMRADDLGEFGHLSKRL